MDRPTIKLEIPLPRWPSSPRARFTTRTLLGAIAVIAVGLAIYTHARKSERAQHTGGYFHLIVSQEHRMNSETLRCVEFPSVLELARSHEVDIRQVDEDADPNIVWPPKIWISRVDWNGTPSEKRVVVPCAGTREEPQIDPSISIELGDRAVFDYAKESDATAEEATDEGKSFDEALESAITTGRWPIRK